MSKFIITLDGGTREQRNAVTDIFKSKGWNLWHWMEDVWLLSQVPNEITTQQIGKELEAHPLIGSKIKLIIRVPDSTGSLNYWGNNQKPAWDWMATHWGQAG